MRYLVDRCMRRNYATLVQYACSRYSCLLCPTVHYLLDHVDGSLSAVDPF